MKYTILSWWLLSSLALADSYVVILPDVTTFPGQSFELPIIVEDGNLMRALDLWFNYDPTMMVIPNDGGMSSPRLGDSDGEHATAMANFTVPGRAGIWWWDVSPLPPGEAHLYTIDCFTPELAPVGSFQVFDITSVIVDEKPHVTSWIGGTQSIVPEPSGLEMIVTILVIAIPILVLAIALDRRR